MSARPGEQRSDGWTLIARRVYRIGVQCLWEKDGRYFVTIKNRTYRSWVEISPEKAAIWRQLLESP